MENFRNAILLLLSFLPLCVPAMAQSKGTDSIAFLGTATAVNHAPGLPLSCGVMAPSVLIQYHIERIYFGHYLPSEILVDVLVCGLGLGTEMKEGNRVLVIAQRVNRIHDEIDSLGVRRKSSQKRAFFRALSIAKPIYAER